MCSPEFIYYIIFLLLFYILYILSKKFNNFNKSYPLNSPQKNSKKMNLSRIHRGYCSY